MCGTAVLHRLVGRVSRVFWTCGKALGLNGWSVLHRLAALRRDFSAAESKGIEIIRNHQVEPTASRQFIIQKRHGALAFIKQDRALGRVSLT